MTNMDKPKPQSVIPQDLIDQLKALNEEVGLARSAADAAEGRRKYILEEFFDDAKKPQELMGRAYALAESMSLQPSVVLKWLGQQINRGDWTILDTKKEKIGVLYLGDIFEVGEIGKWEAIDQSTIVWYMSGDPDSPTT